MSSSRRPPLSMRAKPLLFLTLSAIAGTIFFGIVRDMASAALTWFVNHSNSIQQNPWPWIISGIALTVVIVIILFALLLSIWHDRAIKSHALDMANKMLALDNSVFRMLPISTTNNPDEQKRILKEVLRHIIMVFGGPVERAAILLRDPAKLSHLRCWAHYHMTDDDIQSLRCDMGSDSQIQRDKGGVAGKSFLTGQILVAHLEKGQWVCNIHTQQINFAETHPFSPYQSFVNVPITISNTQTNTTTRIGILHLESRSADTFDSQEIEIMLKELASRIAALIEGTNSMTAKQADSSNAI